MGADLMSDPLLLPPDMAIMVLIGRQTTLAGQTHVITRPAIIPEKLRKLLGPTPQFSRKRSLTPWDAPEQSQKSHFKPWPREHIALSVMLMEGIGRPSTWSVHAMKFAVRDLLSVHCMPTAKAWTWRGSSPPQLLQASTSRQIEALLEKWDSQDAIDINNPFWREWLEIAIAKQAIKALHGGGLAVDVAEAWRLSIRQDAAVSSSMTSASPTQALTRNSIVELSVDSPRRSGFAGLGVSW